jgi:serine/threonine-protein kinase
VRRFPESRATFDRVLAFEPANQIAQWGKVASLWATGDLNAAEQFVANPGVDSVLGGMQALFQRRYSAAIEMLSKALTDAPEWKKQGLFATALRCDALFSLALAQQRAGDAAGARATYQRAVQYLQRRLEKVVPGTLQEGDLRASLGIAYAGLGEAAAAISEGQKAMALDPASVDPPYGPEQEHAMAGIYALLGDSDHAIPILKRLLRIPYHGSLGTLTPALLRLDPLWDQIRNDPRFQGLLAEKKP